MLCTSQLETVGRGTARTHGEHEASGEKEPHSCASGSVRDPFKPLGSTDLRVLYGKYGRNTKTITAGLDNSRIADQNWIFRINFVFMYAYLTFKSFPEA